MNYQARLLSHGMYYLWSRVARPYFFARALSLPVAISAPILKARVSFIIYYTLLLKATMSLRENRVWSGETRDSLTYLVVLKSLIDPAIAATYVTHTLLT